MSKTMNIEQQRIQLNLEVANLNLKPQRNVLAQFRCWFSKHVFDIHQPKDDVTCTDTRFDFNYFKTYQCTCCKQKFTF